MLRLCTWVCMASTHMHMRACVPYVCVYINAYMRVCVCVLRVHVHVRVPRAMHVHVFMRVCGWVRVRASRAPAAAARERTKLGSLMSNASRPLGKVTRR